MKNIKNSSNFWFELFGWYGFLALMMAYALVSFKIISGDSWIYQLLNLTGSIGLLLIAVNKKVYQSVVLNIIWSMIGIIAIIKLFL